MAQPKSAPPGNPPSTPAEDVRAFVRLAGMLILIFVVGVALNLWVALFHPSYLMP